MKLKPLRDSLEKGLTASEINCTDRAQTQALDLKSRLSYGIFEPMDSITNKYSSS